MYAQNLLLLHIDMPVQILTSENSLFYVALRAAAVAAICYISCMMYSGGNIADICPHLALWEMFATEPVPRRISGGKRKSL